MTLLSSVLQKVIAGVIVIGVVGLGLYFWTRPSNLATLQPTMTSVESGPRLTGGTVTFTDTTGERERVTLNDDVGDVETTISISETDSTGKEWTRQLFVEEQRAWFPGITGQPSMIVRGVDERDTWGVVTTQQSTQLFGFDGKHVMAGGSYIFPDGPALTLAYMPVRIWAFRFGPALHVIRGPEITPHVSSGVEMRSNLFLTATIDPSILVTPNETEMSFGIVYRF